MLTTQKKINELIQKDIPQSKQSAYFVARKALGELRKPNKNNVNSEVAYFEHSLHSLGIFSRLCSSASIQKLENKQSLAPLDLSCINLDSANLKGTDLTGAKGVDCKKLQDFKAKTDEKTKLPDGKAESCLSPLPPSENKPESTGK